MRGSRGLRIVQLLESIIIIDIPFDMQMSETLLTGSRRRRFGAAGNRRGAYGDGDGPSGAGATATVADAHARAATGATTDITVRPARAKTGDTPRSVAGRAAGERRRDRAAVLGVENGLHHEGACEHTDAGRQLREQERGSHGRIGYGNNHKQAATRRECFERVVSQSTNRAL